ncbi:MAG TPA: hypothetical protein VGZ02_08185 [Candidatus Baltobacteraceae bacterium]|jgi:hypothetical protein|nr:hypothetical protein [Candidatus Baltobacteraceae bacterium]
MKTRALIRAAFIIALTAIPVITSAGDLALPWHPWASFGFGVDQTGTVTAVDPVAARAGLRAGDRVAVDQMAASDRWVLSSTSIARDGRRLLVPLASGRTVTVVAHPHARSVIDNVTVIFAILGAILYILLAALLVLIRPSPVTWAFYVFSYAYCFAGTLFPEYMPFEASVSLAIFISLASSASFAAMFSFALRFPDDRLSGAALTVERVFFYGVAPIAAACGISAIAAFLLGHVAAATTLINASNFIAYAAIATAIVALLVRYVTAASERRNRLRWIVLAFAFAYVPVLALNIIANVFGVFPGIWVDNIALAWMLLAPMALAYTIFKHRLFDIRLVVSRTLVYGVLTSIIVGVLALVDWAFGRWIAESRFAIFGELALALALGTLLTTVHRRIEHSLNHIIFRAQTLALHALRRFTQEIDLIPDPRRLLLQTYDALRTRLESDYVGIYAADGGSFVLGTPGSDALPTLLPGDDFAVLRLRRWSEAFECDEPEHPLRGALLLPMTARTQLVGFIACGPKRDHTHYLPEEVETLSALAHRAGSAYGWMTVRQPLSVTGAPTAAPL